ncbi:MAG TPA: tetratricopeptide repeat protein, partial [Balneolales bacterium]|nr:tetratricopeptide repeat protein [Balneolales bacterium]
ALDLYQQAIDLDPEFALAYARKAQMLATYPDYTAAIPLAEKALALNPNLPEAHIAMGDIHLWGTWNLKQALEQFIQANTLMPNNAEILTALGDAYMELGKWQQAREELDRATKLDPRNNICWRRLGMLYSYLRQYTKALQAFHRALELSPGDEETKVSLLPHALWLTGRLDSARQLITESIDSSKLGPPVNYTVQYSRLGRIAMSERNFPEARKYFGRIQPSLIYYPYFRGHIRDPNINIIRLDLIVGQHDRARMHALNLRDSLTHYYNRWYMSKNLPYRAGYYVIFAWLKTGLGDKKGAVKAAQQAINIVSQNGLFETNYKEVLAEIYTQTGQKDEALSLIQQLINRPDAGFALTRESLCHDPVWDPLRQDPRFIALLKE